MPKLLLNYGAHCGKGLRINCDHLGIFNLRRNLDTRGAFSLSAST